MTVIKKAIVKSYDAATHKATVQIAGSLGVWLDGIRVATDIPAEDVVVDRQCTVLFLDPSNQDDALVLTIQGELPSGDGAAAPAGNTVVTETSFGQSSDKGTNTQYSRRDHTHGTPADPVPAHATHADHPINPIHYDAIVDGVGTKTGHYAQITGAIAADAVNIFVMPKPSAGRYDAFTVAGTDDVKSIVGAGPGVLVGTVTVDKDEVFLSDLETNGRFTVTAATCDFHRIVCRAAGDTGFTMGPALNPALSCSFTDCAVMEANAGVAFDMAHALHGIRLVNFRVRNFTGTHVISTTQPDHIIIGLDLNSTTVAPTQEPILVDGQGAGGAFTLVDSNLGCTVPNTYNCVKVLDMAYLLLQNIASISDAADATPSIYLDHTGGVYYLVNLASGGTTLFNIPSTSTGLTILIGCVAGQELVTGTGASENRSCKQGAAAVSDTYTAYNILRSSDNAGAIGTVVYAWAQINAHIHRIRNYADYKTVTAPADPAMSGISQASRVYARAIDADNDGLFVKIKKAGAISEVQIA